MTPAPLAESQEAGCRSESRFGPMAIIFDLDGVLIDSLTVMKDAYAASVSDIGSAPPFKAYQDLLGRALPDIATRLGLPPDFCERYLRNRDARPDAIGIQPGVQEMLHAIRLNGMAIGVATGKDGDSARRVLERLNLLDLVDVVIGGDEAPAAKPSPKHVRAVLDALPGKPHLADRVMVVGDADADIVSARQAGCISAFAAWGYTDLSALSLHPDFILNTPSDVCGAIQQLESERSCSSKSQV